MRRRRTFARLAGKAAIGQLTRRALYRLAASERVGRELRGNGVVRGRALRAAGPYLGGTSLDGAVSTVKRLEAEGFAVGVDYFGEAVTDASVVERRVEEYVRLADALDGLPADANVWLDLSNVGLDVSAELCRRQVERILERLPTGARLQIRAHDSTRAEAILGLSLALAADGVPITQTLQANLRRSTEYAERLLEANVPTLLVKGAHIEPRGVAFGWGEETDLAFVRLAHRLHADGARLSIATHDPVIREALLGSLDGIGVEMLLGVRSADARDLLARGHRVRLYVPYGEDWPRYWLRRLGERQGS